MIVDNLTAYALRSRARLWNLMLGGNEDYEIERYQLGRLRAVAPGFDRIATNEIAFIGRAWRWATGIRGIRQVLHVGAPLSAGRYAPHQMLAQPGHVVYVEGDQLLYTKGAAWLEARQVEVVHVDPLDLDATIDAIAEKFDLLAPVAVIAPSLLHWLGESEARTWIVRLAEELSAGSCLVATHLLDPGQPEITPMINRIYEVLDSAGLGAAFFRRRRAIEALCPDLPLEHPGVTPVVSWWPNGPDLAGTPSPIDDLLAAVVVTVPASP